MSLAHYMVDITLPDEITEDFVALVPFQRQRVDHLMGEGIIVSYSLTLDRTKLWAAVIADSEEEVVEIISTFPIASWITYSVHELIFHNSISNNFPVISLN
jgi:hypothetical protein